MELSGIWEGTSISRSNDPTAWNNTQISFNLGPSGTRGTINGHGISMWRNMNIEFTLSGQFDTEAKTIFLRKQHVGEYTNCVVYSGTLDPDAQTISGEYANGVINLRKKEEVRSSNVENLFSGAWEGSSISRSTDPTTWSDLQLQFRLGDDQRHGIITGAGISLWRNQEIQFDLTGTFDWHTKECTLWKQHKGRYTNMVEYNGLVIPETCSISGQYPNGTINLTKTSSLTTQDQPNATDMRTNDFDFTESETQKRERQAKEAAARARAANARRMEVLLSGIWQGESRDNKNNTTIWADTAVRFRMDAMSHEAQVEGRGVSLWRNMRINFQITGKCHLRTGSISLIKQHTGRYTNRVQYDGVLKTLTEGQNMDEFFGHRDDEVGDSGDNGGPLGDALRISLDEISDDAPWIKGGFCIEGVYAKGKIRLMKTAGIGVELGLDNPQEQSSSSASNLEEPLPEKLNRYKLFLSGVLVGGSISARELEVLSKYRASEEIDDEEHEQVLKVLGWNKALFETALQTEADSADEDTCKICFENRINVVIVPCGHFAVCMRCSGHLEKCPICRHDIKSIQQIFRS